MIVPDNWVIISFTLDDGTNVSKILATWNSGYLESGSWRTSSGITNISVTDHLVNITNESGSIYGCSTNNMRVGKEGLHVIGILKKECKNVNIVDSKDKLESFIKENNF